jgi:hypothetical protein
MKDEAGLAAGALATLKIRKISCSRCDENRQYSIT